MQSKYEMVLLDAARDKEGVTLYSERCVGLEDQLGMQERKYDQDVQERNASIQLLEHQLNEGKEKLNELNEIMKQSQDEHDEAVRQLNATISSQSSALESFKRTQEEVDKLSNECHSLREQLEQTTQEWKVIFTSIFKRLTSASDSIPPLHSCQHARCVFMVSSCSGCDR